MHVSKEVDYGLKAIIVIASNPDGHLNTKQISQRYRIPINFLSLILPKLVREGLIESIKGPKGGYKLAKEASEISFLHVMEALEGPLCLIDHNFANHSDNSDDSDSFCTFVKAWRNIKSELENCLDQITLEKCINPELSGAKVLDHCFK